MEWSAGSINQEFDNTKSEINSVVEDSHDVEITKSDGVFIFFANMGYAIKLVFQEKEIMIFALLQWAAIGLGYYLWVQMLGWIPPEVWKGASESDHGSIVDIILLVWSFVCVGIVAFPLSILSGCMGAVHFLRKKTGSSSIAACLKIVLPQIWSLWIFYWIDGWITVNKILDRLPKKNDKTPPEQRALSEALYYAWKLGTIGILPALLTGNGLVESCRKSIAIVRHKFLQVSGLRIGYSALCWIVGIAAYIGTILFFVKFNNLVPGGKEEVYSHIYTFYFWAGVPLIIAVAIIELFLRPVYLIMACNIYSDYIAETNEKIVLPNNPSKAISAVVAFLVLCIILLVVFLYRDKLGITAMLSTPYK